MKIKSIPIVAVIFAVCLLTGCGNKGRQSTIIVSGLGTVMAQPDTAQMSISLNSIAPTTSQAQQEVNAMVKQALTILQNAGIDEKSISTTSLRFFPEYEWGGPRRLLLGQKAEQVITFSVNEVSQTNPVSHIIDQLIQINGIEMHQMSFYVKDNTALYAQSRELAYQKALEKAEQYARLSGLKVVKALTISEEGNTVVSPFANQMRSAKEMAFATADQASGSALPTGEMEITSRVLVEFLVK